MQVVSSFASPSLSSYPRRTTISGHHHDAYTSLIPWLKSLFFSSGIRTIVGNKNCANGTYIVNITVNNNNASLTSSLHFLGEQHDKPWTFLVLNASLLTNVVLALKVQFM